VSVSSQIALEKQRAMHPAMVYKEKVYKEKEETPMPYRKEYAQPGLLYPVSNHCLSITADEFGTASYAFLMSLNRLGAGNPKGVAFARAVWDGTQEEPLLVVDEYRVPLAERPVISPTITDNNKAVEIYMKLAKAWSSNTDGKFDRKTGNAALAKLQEAAKLFEKNHLQT
jgi:hypothetical protein